MAAEMDVNKLMLLLLAVIAVLLLAGAWGAQ